MCTENALTYRGYDCSCCNVHNLAVCLWRQGDHEAASLQWKNVPQYDVNANVFERSRSMGRGMPSARFVKISVYVLLCNYMGSFGPGIESGLAQGEFGKAASQCSVSAIVRSSSARASSGFIAKLLWYDKIASSKSPCTGVQLPTHNWRDFNKRSSCRHHAPCGNWHAWHHPDHNFNLEHRRLNNDVACQSARCGCWTLVLTPLSQFCFHCYSLCLQDALAPKLKLIDMKVVRHLYHSRSQLDEYKAKMIYDNYMQM